ncbi:MAG: hypothetical protein GY830_09065 [Bacteroidetes bacterium]|nr:hypothetical protein [Bacteroidota bacterium]
MKKDIIKIFSVVMVIFIISCGDNNKPTGNTQSLGQEQEEKDKTQSSSSTSSDNTDSTTTTSEATTIPQTRSFGSRGIPFTESEKSSIDNFKNKIEKFYDDNFEKEEKEKAFNELLNKIKNNLKEIDSIDSYNGSALLMYAAEQGDLDTVKLLLSKEVDINKKSKSGYTALHYSILSGNEKLVKLLLDNRADAKIKVMTDFRNKKEEQNIMEYALGTIYSWDKKLKGNSKIIKLLIEKGGFSINSKDMPGNDSEPLIVRATTRGDIDFAKYLINKGVDINSQDSYKYTSLLKAAQNGDMDMLKLLIKNKADLTKRDKWGNDVLHRAVSPSLVDSSDALEFLMKQNLNPNSIDKDGYTPIFSACDQFSRNAPKMALEMLKILLKNNKVDVNHVSKDGYFPLLEAVKESTPEIVKTLLDHNANPNQRYKNKKTPLFAGFANQKWDNAERLAKNVTLLIPYASDYDVKEVAKMVGVKNFETSNWIWETMMNKMTKFNLSADELNTTNIVKLCLQHPDFSNVDINKKNAEGKNLLNIAKLKKYEEVINLLIQKGAKTST